MISQLGPDDQPLIKTIIANNSETGLEIVIALASLRYSADQARTKANSIRVPHSREENRTTKMNRSSSYLLCALALPLLYSSHRRYAERKAFQKYTALEDLDTLEEQEGNNKRPGTAVIIGGRWVISYLNRSDI